MPTSKNKIAQKKVPGEISAIEKLAQEADFLDREHQEAEALRPFRQAGRLATAPENELGQRVQEARQSLHLTQGDLANLTKSLDAEDKGISRAVLSLYEAGTNRPSPREIRLLCEALRVTPNYLIYGDEVPFHEANDHHRLGTRSRHSPEGFAWMACVMATAHHNHYDAVMKLLLDLARGWNKQFDQGMQDKANAMLLDMAAKLQVEQNRKDENKASKSN
jgi:transcriptional regulator with XRE-family HTH domain